MRSPGAFAARLPTRRAEDYRGLEMDRVHSEARRFLTLERLAGLLGAGTVELLTCPRGGEVEVTGPRIYDPLDPTVIGPGEVVLGVNVAADAVPLLIKRAGQAGAAAAILRAGLAAETATADLANFHATALFSASEALTWDQLYGIIRSAANATPESEGWTPEVILGDLFALANALAASVGGAVSIEDPRSNLLAYSNLDQPIDEARQGTILGRRTPPRWEARLEEEGIVQQLRSLPPKVIHIRDPRGETRDRLATGVWAGTELVGIIWVIEGDRPLDRVAESHLEQSAPLAALHILRHRSSEDLSSRQRGALLEAFLEGRRPLGEVATELRLDPNAPCAMVVFDIAVDDPADLAVKRSRAIDFIGLACESFRRQVVCAASGRSICVLFPGMTEGSDGRLAALVKEITQQAADSLRISIRAGIGPTVSGLARAPASRADAERVLRVLLSRSVVSSVAHIDEVSVASTLLEIGDFLRDHPELRPQGLQAMEEYDQSHGKSYLATIRVVCEAGWDISEAARKLNLHSNTLRYRIKRFEALSGLSLDDARHRLVVSLYLLTA